MDTSTIGNKRQQDDNRIAVLHARQLGKCWKELSALVGKRDSSSLDARSRLYQELLSWVGGDETPEKRAWIRLGMVEEKAVRLISDAIEQGQLQIWRTHNAAELALPPCRLLPDDVRYGVYRSMERPAADAHGALLWVKNEDWRRFLATTVRAFGKKRQPSVEAEPSLGAASKPRGRPTGSGGHAMADAPLIKAMRVKMLGSPGMTVHFAASQFAPDAVGGSFERRVRRLAQRYRATYPVHDGPAMLKPE